MIPTVTYKVDEVPDAMDPVLQVIAGGDVHGAVQADVAHMLRTLAVFSIAVGRCINPTSLPTQPRRSGSTTTALHLLDDPGAARGSGCKSGDPGGAGPIESFLPSDTD